MKRIGSTGAVALIGVFVFSTLSLFANPDPPGSISFKSRRYQVTTDLDRREADRIARHMDTAFEEYTRRLSGFPVRHGMAVRLYLFSTQQGYNDFLATIGVNAQNTAGIFWSQYDGGLASWVEGQDSASMFHTLQHEGFHQFARIRIGTEIPQWANEGLAEYFGVGLLLRGKFTLGLRPSGKLGRVAAGIRDGGSLPFEELLTMSNEEWNRRVNTGDQSAGMLYDQSWSIVHFLVHADNGRYAGAFESFLKLVSQGRTADQAFQGAFGTSDYDLFEERWKAYTLELTPDPVSTGVERAQFLAAGLRAAHEADAPCASVEELRLSLRKLEFLWYIESHGAVRIVSADDEELFEAPAPERKGRTSSITISPSDDPELPPGLAIEGLKARISVAWTLDSEGEPAPDIRVE